MTEIGLCQNCKHWQIYSNYQGETYAPCSKRVYVDGSRLTPATFGCTRVESREQERVTAKPMVGEQGQTWMPPPPEQTPEPYFMWSEQAKRDRNAKAHAERRFVAATAALEGLVTGVTAHDQVKDMNEKRIAEIAVTLADALLAELDKKP